MWDDQERDGRCAVGTGKDLILERKKERERELMLMIMFT